MSQYVLVHGAWHGAWCWEKVTPLLEQAGHTVTTLDLPGHGHSTDPVAGKTLEDYALAVADLIRVQAGPVILVGHSMGGAVITRAAELHPEGIEALVYLAAFLVPDGMSIFDVGRMNRGDAGEAEAQALQIDPGTQTATIAPLHLPAFYSDCPPAVVEWAAQQVGRESLLALASPVRHTPERFGRLPRFYIECQQDQIIPIALQRWMHAQLPCQAVMTLDASHSPFASMPGQVADLVNRVSPARQPTRV